MRDDGYTRRFSFGPLERRGVAGGLRTGQLALLAGGAILAVAILRTTPTGTGLLVAVLAVAGCAGVAFVPYRGRTAEEWLPVVVAYRRRPRDHRSAQPSTGAIAQLDGTGYRRAIDLPDALAGCAIVPHAVGGDREVGIFTDREAHTLTAVMAVRVRAFGLLSEAEQERRLDRWGMALASLARSGSVVRRVQILERTVPADGDALQRYLLEARDRALDSGALPRRSYEALLDGAGAVTQDHELFLAVQVDDRAVTRRAGRPADAAAALVRELQTLASRFDPSDVVVDGVLSPRMLARAIRLAYDPYGRGRMNRLGVVTGDGGGAEPDAFGPLATSERWDAYRSDSAHHRTYWIAQWPRLLVAPTFLAPLLLSADVVRSLSVVLEPVPPERARRSVEAAITADLADEQLRAERGFRTTARRRKRQDATVQREQELSAGHQEFRFAAFVTVSGADEDDLELACEQVEQAAHQAYLDIQPLWGEQDAGFTFGALPIARGLRSGGMLS